MGGVSFPMMLPNIMKFKIFLISCQPNGLWMLFNWIWITSLRFYRDKENINKRMLTLKNWLQQEKGFKRITKKLKMVHLFSFLLYCNFTGFINLGLCWSYLCLCVLLWWSQKAKNNSGDGHPWDPKTQECLLWKEQRW